MKFASIIALVGVVSSVTIARDNVKNWVELPDCKGAKGEVKLIEDLEFGHSPLNASNATCKPRPAKQVGA